MFKRVANIFNPALSNGRIKKTLKEHNVTEETVMGTEVMEEMFVRIGVKEKNNLSGHVTCDVPTARRFLKALFTVLKVNVSSNDIDFLIDRCGEDKTEFALDEFLSLIKHTVPRCKLLIYFGKLLVRLTTL